MHIGPGSLALILASGRALVCKQDDATGPMTPAELWVDSVDGNG
jgi:hypothetical protein